MRLPNRGEGPLRGPFPAGRAVTHPHRTSAIVPHFSLELARELAARHYDLDVTARDLPSYVDQNFHLLDSAGAEYVLKVFNSDEDPALIDAQISALRHVGGGVPGLATPRVVPCLDGAPATRAEGHRMWLGSYLPGRPLAGLPHPAADLLRDLGRGLGELDARLASFAHPALTRAFPWDPRQAPRALEFVGHIADAAAREAVRARLERFESEFVPVVERLPFQSIHNDANDHNVIVLGAGETRLGLVDFGDIVRTARACEPAIAMAYAMSAADDPLRAGAQVLAGYHESLALGRDEIRVVPHLIAARLCVSVTMSAHGRERDPENAYLSVSEASAWGLLEWACANPPARWVEAFEEACESVRPIERNATGRATDEA